MACHDSSLWTFHPAQHYGVTQGIGAAALLAVERLGQYILMPWVVASRAFCALEMPPR